MKRFLRYILAAAVALGFAACQEEEWTPGEMDYIDCHGLFFPQEQATDYVLSPTDAKFLTFTVERTETDDEAEVPYELIGSEEGFFDIEEETIYFDEGQKKATFKVLFTGDFELGEKYTCSIKVTDPLYVSQYALSSSELTFTVTFVEWKRLKGTDGSDMGIWRDDFFTSLGQQVGANLAQPYLEKEVAVYERSDLPGYYKVDEIYTASYLSQIYAGDESYTESLEEYCLATSIYINASNPDKVFIDAQFAFYDPFLNYGAAYICSDVEDVFDAGYSNSYGVMKNGVISFPIKNSLVIFLPSAGTAYANLAGKTRLVLPGYRGYDYSLDLDYSPSENGVLPMEFNLGLDVAKVEYQVFDGHLNDVEFVSKLEEVKSRKNVKSITASGTYDFTTEESGFYTLIACVYDAEDKFQGYEMMKFGYDTVDDPREVDINLGLIVSDKHAPIGLTAETSMEFYIYGSDIVTASAAIFKKSQYADFKENIEYNVQNASALRFNKYQLDTINTTGYSGLVGNLTPGVEYCLIVYADNGYHSGFFTATATTEGIYDIMNEEFDVFDLPGRLQPESHDGYFNKKWDIWSLDPYKVTTWTRTKRGTAEFEDADDVMFDANGEITKDPSKAETTMDYISLIGMHANASEKYGFDNSISFEYYDGFIYSLMTPMPMTELKADHYELNDKDKLDLVAEAGTKVYPTNAYLYFAGGMFNPNLENFAMIGGFVTEEKDVIAFVGNPNSKMGSYGFSYVAMQLCYFLNESYTGDGSLVSMDCHAYPILVSPDSQHGSSLELASLQAPTECNAISMELQKPRRNMVETESGYVKSTIDMVGNAMPRNYMQDVIPVMVDRGIQAADFSMTPSSSKIEKSSELKEMELTKRTLR